MTLDHSGPAFPTHPNAAERSDGMTLRDYFAGQALAGLPSHMKEFQTDHRIKIAEWAYGLADAMLEARK